MFLDRAIPPRGLADPGGSGQAVNLPQRCLVAWALPRQGSQGSELQITQSSQSGELLERIEILELQAPWGLCKLFKAGGQKGHHLRSFQPMLISHLKNQSAKLVGTGQQNQI